MSDFKSKRKTWFLVSGLLLLTFFMAIKMRPTADSSATSLETESSSSSAPLKAEDNSNASETSSEATSEVSNVSRAPLSHRAKVYKGTLPPHFPIPKMKGEFRYVAGGAPESPTVKLPDGKAMMLLPLKYLKLDESAMTNEMKANSLEEKLKDPEYRKALEAVGGLPENKTTFFSWSKIIKKVTSFFHIKDAIASEPETVLLDDIVTREPDGSFRHQGDRLTCAVFSLLAGMESAYLRDYGIALNLSEHYANHLNKSTMPHDESNNDIEMLPSVYLDVTDIVTVADKLANYSVPLESYAPYWSRVQLDQFIAKHTPLSLKKVADPAFRATKDDQLIFDTMEYAEEYIPQAARDNANYRVKKNKWTWMSGSNLQSFEGYLRARQPLAICVNWKLKVVNGIHVYDETQGGFGHYMLIVGFHNTGDEATSYLVIKNSFGGKDYMLMSYEAARKVILIALAIEEVEPPTAPVPFTTKWLGNWNVSNDGWRGRLLVRRVKEGQRLGTFFAEGERYGKPVTAKIFNNGRSLTYYIFDNWVPATTLKGQPYTLHQYSWFPRFASGHTVWNKKQYGLHASLFPLERLMGGRPLTAKDHWVGNWRFCLDGRMGTLQITRVKDSGQINGFYMVPGKKTEAVTGQKVSGHAHLADLKIEHGPKFRLMRFTREPGRASGMTTEGKSSYGVSAEYLSAL